MSRRRISPPGEEHYMVRVVLPGAMLHLASSTEPRVSYSEAEGCIDDVTAEWLDDPELGDTVGYIAWSAVVSITWRWTGTDSDD